MKIIAITIWCLFALYLTVNVVVGSHPVAKELPQTINIEKNIKIINEWKKSPITKIQKIMIPVWRYNRYIYALLLFSGFLFTFLARNKKTDNKSFKMDATKRRGAL